MRIQIMYIVYGLTLAACLGMTGCFGGNFARTTDIPPVETFDIERYTGTWYEIARLPNSFEKNLDQVTATYTVKENGKVQVLNKGFDTKKSVWKDIIGRAWIPNAEQPASLKVSFFWIFASDYKVIALDQEAYSYAMVTSSTTKYLWILSRTPTLDDSVYDRLVQQAAADGFAVEALYRVNHE